MMRFMCRALREHFQEKGAAAGASPSLSVKALTAAMTKREAARIFYQICGEHFSLLYGTLCQCIELASC